MTLPPLPEVNYLGDDVSYGYDACDMREYGAACAAAERERCAKLCDEESAAWGGVANGPMATDQGKRVLEAIAAGAKNCAAAIRAKEKP